MNRRRDLGALAIAAVLVATGAAASGAEEKGLLQPFQMVRSLEQIQDRIAGGDHAALPMQRKLLEMIDARFAANLETRFDIELNRRALLVYAMSGGNPSTVESALSRLGRDDPVVKLGGGILAYIKGEPKAARDALGAIDPMVYSPDLGAYLALVKASVLSEDEPKMALGLLDQARLLVPGTLVEEAALRRSVAIATTLRDERRFLSASEQYVRSYLRSPYASQFADAFVAGVIALHVTLDLQAVSEIAALMEPEQEKVIFLRIARRAAIDGLIDLSSFASARAEGEADDPRALLYSSLSSVTSGTVSDVLGKLSQIDRDRLSENDRKLLDAASAIATEVSAAPVGMPDRVSAPEPSPIRSVGPETELAVEQPLADVRPSAKANDDQPEASDTVPTRSASSVDATADEADAMMTTVRAKLSDIDKLLGDMPE